MKNMHDLTQIVYEKVDECPNCHAKLEQKGRLRIECPTCGFIIKTDTKSDLYLTYAFMGGMIALIIGLFIGISWTNWLNSMKQLQQLQNTTASFIHILRP
jgi:predicted RNA-binding Zn-ribbon protein involved in translation (DUF1610 family)